jgi:hypothetical protein
MVQSKRITAIYLGALLLDGIIEADSAMIAKVIHSLDRAAFQVEIERGESMRSAPPAVDDVQAFSARLDQSRPSPNPSMQQARNDTHNRRAQDTDIDTDPPNAS